MKQLVVIGLTSEDKSPQDSAQPQLRRGFADPLAHSSIPHGRRRPKAIRKLSHDFFDPTPEQQNVLLIDAATLQKAQRMIAAL